MLTGLQHLPLSRSHKDTPPLLVPGVLCVPPLVPQCGGIAVPAGDRSSPHPPVLCHLLTAGTPCTSTHTSLCTPSHLAQGAHTFHTSHDLIPNGCSHIPVALHMPTVCVPFSLTPSLFRSSQNNIYLCVEVKAVLFIAWVAGPSPLSGFHLGI